MTRSVRAPIREKGLRGPDGIAITALFLLAAFAAFEVYEAVWYLSGYLPWGGEFWARVPGPWLWAAALALGAWAGRHRLDGLALLLFALCLLWVQINHFRGLLIHLGTFDEWQHDVMSWARVPLWLAATGWAVGCVSTFFYPSQGRITPRAAAFGWSVAATVFATTVLISMGNREYSAAPLLRPWSLLAILVSGGVALMLWNRERTDA